MRLLERLEDWGLDHLEFILCFALAFNVTAFVIVVVLAVAA